MSQKSPTNSPYANSQMQTAMQNSMGSRMAMTMHPTLGPISAPLPTPRPIAQAPSIASAPSVQMSFNPQMSQTAYNYMSAAMQNNPMTRMNGLAQNLPSYGQITQSANPASPMSGTGNPFTMGINPIPSFAPPPPANLPAAPLKPPMPSAPPPPAWSAPFASDYQNSLISPAVSQQRQFQYF